MDTAHYRERVGHELTASRDWVSHELAAGRDWAAQELTAAREAEWAEWWSTGWVSELVEATAETAGQAWEVAWR